MLQVLVDEIARPLRVLPLFWREPWLQDGIVYKLNFPVIDRMLQLLSHVRPRNIDNHNSDQNVVSAVVDEAEEKDHESKRARNT